MATTVRKWFLVVACAVGAAMGTGAFAAEEMPDQAESVTQLPPVRTLRPIDTGRNATFFLGPTNLYSTLAVKVNLLYGVVKAPNLGVEVALGPKLTLELTGGYSSWAKGKAALENGTENSGFKRFEHWLAKPELRFWPGGQRFNGHFVGVQAIYGDYNVARTEIPMLFEKEYLYDGNGYGAGLVYGYHWTWSDRWGMQLSLGVGALQMKYVRKECSACDDKAVKFKKNYFGPTSAGVKLVFMIK